MNTTWKRFTALLMAAAFVLVAVPSMALAAVTPSDILVDTGTLGSITIHKYAVGDLADYDTPNFGKAPTGNELDNASAVAGIQFRVVSVASTTNLSTISSLVSAVRAGNTSAADIDTAAKALGNNSYEALGTTDANGVVSFGWDKDALPPEPIVSDDPADTLGTLPHGLYLVVELPSDLSDAPVDPFLVNIPYTYSDGAELIYDVHVYPKNELSSELNISKTITNETSTDDSLGYTDTITWFIHTEIPNGIDSLYDKYEITDTLDQLVMFDPVASPLSASDINFEAYYYTGASGNTKTTLAATHYTLTINSAAVPHSIKFELGATGYAQLAQATSATADLPQLTIKFDTILNTGHANAETTLATPIKNTAKMEYKMVTWSAAEEATSNEAEFHYGGIAVRKVNDASSPVSLEGAQFMIFETRADAEALTNPLPHPSKTPAEPWVITTGSDGIALFWGLTYYDGTKASGDAKDDDQDEGERTYWLVETRAPLVDQTEANLDADGVRYNLVGEPIEVKVNKDSHKTTVVDDIAKIVNRTGFELPSTGGIGTMVFTIVGLGLICAAVIVLAVSRKRGKNQQ